MNGLMVASGLRAIGDYGRRSTRTTPSTDWRIIVGLRRSVAAHQVDISFGGDQADPSASPPHSAASSATSRHSVWYRTSNRFGRTEHRLHRPMTRTVEDAAAACRRQRDMDPYHSRARRATCPISIDMLGRLADGVRAADRRAKEGFDDADPEVRDMSWQRSTSSPGQVRPSQRVASPSTTRRT